MIAITFFSYLLCSQRVGRKVGGRVRCKAINIAVKHAKSSSNKHRIMYFVISGAKFAGGGYILIGKVFAVALPDGQYGAMPLTYRKPLFQAVRP